MRKALEIILIGLGGTVTLLSWVSLLLGEAGLFYRPFFWAAVLGILALLIIWVRKNSTNLIFKKSQILILSLILFFALFNTFFFHDTFFSNRDEGVYANSGILISKYHGFKLPSEKVFFPTLVLDKNDTWFQPSFPFGYPSWLGLNYSLFGINGIKGSNLLLIIVTLLSLYSFAKFFGSKMSGLAVCVLISMSYPYLWFWRRTVSENLVAALVWFGLFCALSAIKKNNKILLALSLLSFGFTLYVRTEALFLYVIFIGLLFIYFIFSRVKWMLSGLLVLIPTIVHYWFYLFTFKEGEINRIIQFFYSINLIELKIPILNDELSAVLPNALAHHLPEFVFNILNQYFLYLPILFIILIPVFFLFKKKREKAVYFVSIILILLPLFIALKSPSIVYDQPWMLRRYMIGIFPLAFLAFSLFTTEVINQKFSRLIVVLVVVVNLIISAPLLFLSEYRGTTENVEELIQGIPKNSIIFTDRFIFTDYYEIYAQIFSLYDIPSARTYDEILENTVIPESTDVYFITHKNNWRNDQDIFSLFFRKRSWQQVAEKDFSFKRLLRTCELLKKYGSGGKVGRLPADQAMQECSGFPSKIESIKTKVVIYKVNPDEVSDYLYRQELFEQYAKKGVILQPRRNFFRENESLNCLGHPCIIRYQLPKKSSVQGFLLFSDPVNYAKEYQILISAEGQNISYRIFNINTQQFEDINSKFIKNNNLDFNAGNSYFTEATVWDNYIDLVLSSPSPIKIKNIQVFPQNK